MLNEIMWEHRRCPLCGADEPKAYRLIEGISIERCTRCRLLYRPSIPADLSVLYDATYYATEPGKEGSRWAGSGDYLADKDRLISTFDEHVSKLEKIKRPPGKLLDIGCATGCLLEAARRRGWVVMGIDISEFAVQKARELFGLEVICGDVESVQLAAEQFDVITCFENIEHVKSPASLLESLRPWLKSDGLLVIATPNAGSLAARRHPERFVGFSEKSHLTYFTRPTMRRLLRDAGFEVLQIQTDMPLVTRRTLQAGGVAQPERLRNWVNKYMPGLKNTLRRWVGNLLGGGVMRVYAVKR